MVSWLLAAAMAAQVETGDIGLFHRERAAAATVEELRSRYFAKASPGWKRYLAGAGDPAIFTQSYRLYPKFFATSEPGCRRGAEAKPEIERALEAFRELYPHPGVPVTIGVGSVSGAGRGERDGVYLAAEFFSKGPGLDDSELAPWQRAFLAPPEGIAAAAVHEMVHVYQARTTDSTLLVACLREGAADFVAELITGRHTNPALVEWASPRKAALFQEFARRAHGSYHTGWIYDAGENSGRPANVGYWIGYEIAKDFHARAAAKRTAIADIVEMRDPRALVAASSYRWLVIPPAAKKRRRR